jgi:hypothetical protein
MDWACTLLQQAEKGYLQIKTSSAKSPLTQISGIFDILSPSLKR